MGKVTNLRMGKGQKKRVNVFMDDKFAFSLQAEVAAEDGLQVGQELSANHIEALTGADRFHRCLDAALRYLSYRPRSEHEIRQQLKRRSFDDEIIETLVAKLKEQMLIDDAAFAQFWKDSRETFSPRSQWLTRSELRRKGINSEIIDQVVDSVDNGSSAYRAALNKARRLPLSDYQEFRHRLGEYLRRRGFSYDVIEHTVAQIWQESTVTTGNISSETKHRGD